MVNILKPLVKVNKKLGRQIPATPNPASAWEKKRLTRSLSESVNFVAKQQNRVAASRILFQPLQNLVASCRGERRRRSNKHSLVVFIALFEPCSWRSGSSYCATNVLADSSQKMDTSHRRTRVVVFCAETAGQREHRPLDCYAGDGVVVGIVCHHRSFVAIMPNMSSEAPVRGL